MTDVRDSLVDAVTKLVGTAEKDTAQHQAERILAFTWNMLSPEVRGRFLSRATKDGFITFEPIWPKADREMNAAARWWPYVIETLDGDELQFARTITKLIRIKRQPSEKQAGWMRQIYRDWRRWKDTDGEVME